MRKLGLNVVTALACLAIASIAFACASDPPEDFVPPGGSSSSGSSTVPGGDGGASSSGGSSGASSSGGSSGSTTDGSTPAADCSKMGQVDSRPACDACTKAKCCSEVKACDASPGCKAAQACVAACPEDDVFCVFQCASGGNGADLLLAVGQCASQQCKTECPSSGFEFDGGLPF